MEELQTFNYIIHCTRGTNAELIFVIYAGLEKMFQHRLAEHDQRHHCCNICSKVYKTVSSKFCNVSTYDVTVINFSMLLNLFKFNFIDITIINVNIA